MIVGIGTDIVEIKRLSSWLNFSDDRLLRIFTQKELNYCRSTQSGYVVERLAARFAAKEAFYKALSSFMGTWLTSVSMPGLLTIAPCVGVSNNAQGAPRLEVDWPLLSLKMGRDIAPLVAHVSLSHEREHAIAFVVLERQ